ncbi:SPASM domain-containing protein [Anaerolineales bacterium HSG24]|nr:SPASM domain-containing protein [Anaerolineales bacterium HSG24]
MFEQGYTPLTVILSSKSHNRPLFDCDFDCDDCDCPIISSNVSNKDISSTSKGLYHSNFYEVSLNYDFSICYTSPYGKPAVLNRSALNLLSQFKQPRDIRVDRFSKPINSFVELGLLTPTNQLQPTLTESPTILTAWFHLTDRCNLRCSYCYLPHHKVDMTLETGQASIAATFRSAVKHNYKTVKLKYSGGEAMLRFPLIRQLHQYAQQLAKQHDMALEGVILSNGTLLKSEIIKQIQQLDLRLMISLDGLGLYQDQQRFYAGGKGTSADVIEAVKLSLSHGLTPYISITVTGQSAAGLPEVIDWVLQHDLPFSLNFYRENELSASHKNLKLEEAKIIDGMLAAFKVIEQNMPRRSLLASLVDRANLSTPHVRTCGVGQSYLVFDHQGHVSKCQMHQSQSFTTAQADDPLALIRADEIGIQNLSVEEKEGCRNCEWKYWCTGGCPIVTYRATGRYDVQSPNCNIYKTLYPEAIRLEGLRLLKHEVLRKAVNCRSSS